MSPRAHRGATIMTNHTANASAIALPTCRALASVGGPGPILLTETELGQVAAAGAKRTEGAAIMTTPTATASTIDDLPTARVPATVGERGATLLNEAELVEVA